MLDLQASPLRMIFVDDCGDGRFAHLSDMLDVSKVGFYQAHHINAVPFAILEDWLNYTFQLVVSPNMLVELVTNLLRSRLTCTELPVSH